MDRDYEVDEEEERWSVRNECLGLRRGEEINDAARVQRTQYSADQELG